MCPRVLSPALDTALPLLEDLTYRSVLIRRLVRNPRLPAIAAKIPMLVPRAAPRAPASSKSGSNRSKTVSARYDPIPLQETLLYPL